MRITGSGISRSDRIKVATTPKRKARVIGEIRFSRRILSTARLRFLGSCPSAEQGLKRETGSLHRIYRKF
jgi:hypothetical protein